jgi:plasmid stability protein
MEEEARAILRSALTASSPQGNLAVAIHRRFAVFGGITVKLPRRDAIRQTADFSK